jgi:hypothetical protein
MDAGNKSWPIESSRIMNFVRVRIATSDGEGPSSTLSESSGAGIQRDEDVGIRVSESSAGSESTANPSNKEPRSTVRRSFLS